MKILLKKILTEEWPKGSGNYVPYIEENSHLGCRYCEGEETPGWIETDNNGPIVRCPVCNDMGKEINHVKP